MSIIEKTLHATMTVGKESILKSFSVRKICRRTGKLYCAEFRECVYCSLLKGSTPDINNSSSSHTLGALYHVVFHTELEGCIEVEKSPNGALTYKETMRKKRKQTITTMTNLIFFYIKVTSRPMCNKSCCYPPRVLVHTKKCYTTIETWIIMEA